MPDAVIDLLRALQSRGPSHLAGGAALAGLYLSHRIDPGVLAWLLRDFPTAPLPRMLSPLTPQDLVAFRSELAERFRRIAVP